MTYAAPIGTTLSDLLTRVVNVAVKVVIFLAILALGWLIARWIWKAVAALLSRIGFDRAAERGGLHRVLGRYTASDVAGRLVEFTFLLFVLQLAFGIFGPNAISDLIARGVAWVPRLFVAVLIVVVAAAVGGWVRQLITEALGGLSYGRVVATADWNVNGPGGFGQPSYRGAMPTDEQPSAAVPEEQLPADHDQEQ
jgi:hypothetical protein